MGSYDSFFPTIPTSINFGIEELTDFLESDSDIPNVKVQK